MTHETRGTAPEFQQEQVQPPLVERWNSNLEEVENVPAYYKRKAAGIWACLAIIVVSLVAAAAYGYSILRQQNVELSQLTEVVQTIPQINRHLVSTDSLLTTTRAEQGNLQAELKKVDGASKTALDRTRVQMAALLAATRRTLLSGISQKAGNLQAELSQLQSQQSAYQVRLAQLESELVQARTELAAVRKDYSEELAAIREQQGQQGQEIETISSSLPTRQVFFETDKNQGTDIAPGISFRLTKTDVGHQRFDGWIETGPGHQKVLVQNQEARSPVMFFPGEEGKPFLLVATHVNQQGVGGYCLIPNASGGTDQAQLIPTSAPEDAPSPVTRETEAR